MLDSWRRRYVCEAESQQVLAQNHDRLRMIAAVSPEWNDTWGDIDALGLEESELWFWRYASEVVDAAGEGCEHYHRIIFRELAEDPIPGARQIFKFAGVPWTDDVERRVAELTKHSLQIATDWEKKLTEDDWRIIHRVLDGSPLSRFWPGLEAKAASRSVAQAGSSTGVGRR
jgi:hypothetical protein